MMDMEQKYSKNEIKMFETIGHQTHLMKIEFLDVLSYYRIVAEYCFNENIRGPAVDALRRARIAQSKCNPYCGTPEYEELIKFY